MCHQYRLWWMSIHPHPSLVLHRDQCPGHPPCETRIFRQLTKPFTPPKLVLCLQNVIGRCPKSINVPRLTRAMLLHHPSVHLLGRQPAASHAYLWLDPYFVNSGDKGGDVQSNSWVGRTPPPQPSPTHTCKLRLSQWFLPHNLACSQTRLQ